MAKNSLLWIAVLCLYGCSVSPEEIQKHIVGTWACFKQDIEKGGLSFYQDGKVTLFRKGDSESLEHIDKIDHLASGSYKINDDKIASTIYYQIPMYKEKEAEYKGLFLPSKPVNLHYNVSQINGRSLALSFLNKFEEQTTLQCERVLEDKVGQYYESFITELKRKGVQIVAISGDPLSQTADNDTKTYQDGLKTLADSDHYRASLAKVLDIVRQASPKNVRVMSVVGQELDYQVLGIADGEETLNTYVNNLKGITGVENAELAANHSFNITSNRDGATSTQRYFEFRVQFTFKPATELGPTPTIEGQSSKALLDELRANFSKASNKLLDHSDVHLALLDIAKFAKSAQVEIMEFSPIEASNTGIMIHAPVSIKLRGGFTHINNFLKAMVNSQHLINMTGIQIEPDPAKPKQPDLILSGYLTFYLKVSEKSSKLKQVFDEFRADFPKPTSYAISGTDNLNNPFTAFAFQVDLTKIPLQASARDFTCQGENQSPIALNEIRYLGPRKQANGETAMLKIQGKKTLNLKEGQCLNKLISVEKIFRTKVVLKEQMRDKQGNLLSRSVSVQADNQ